MGDQVMAAPLMPKATAVWLVENTALTFDQIADFCGLHPLEVQGIADGEVAIGIKGQDPVATSQLSREEIERCEADASTRLKPAKAPARVPERRAKGPRYTPLSKRQERPNAIAWLVRYHPELTDAQVAKLVGTTKPTIESIRDRSHWNISNITPQDPVTLGMCTQTELDSAVQKAMAKAERQRQKEEREQNKRRAESLAAAEEAGMPSAQPVPEEAPEAPSEPEQPAEEPTVANVFGTETEEPESTMADAGADTGADEPHDPFRS
jgi:hypothetical protein